MNTKELEIKNILENIDADIKIWEKNMNEAKKRFDECKAYIRERKSYAKNLRQELKNRSGG